MDSKTFPVPALGCNLISNQIYLDGIDPSSREIHILLSRLSRDIPRKILKISTDMKTAKNHNTNRDIQIDIIIFADFWWVKFQW